MAHRFNTNKQLMVGDDTLAFTAISVVVILVYASLRLQQEKKAVRHFSKTYSIRLTKGFVDDLISLFVNDSLIMNKQIKGKPTTIEVGRFIEQSALMIVNNQTETVAAFGLSEKSGTYRLKKNVDGIKQLPQK